MNNIEEILKANGIKVWGTVSDPKASTYGHFQKWVDDGNNGVLSYLEGERALKRESLSHYFPEFKSALVFAFDYSRTSKIAKEFYKNSDSNGLKIASYVLGFEGSDYHYVLKEQLEKLISDIQKLYPDSKMLHSLDIQPVLERDLAMRAGLGWFGKNSMMINKEIGSFFILGSIFFDFDINEKISKAQGIEVDHCGTCTKCIDACPTDALIVDSRTLIADKCISTFTIELFKDAEAPQGMNKESGEIYGCDICQDVCPWNERVERLSDAVSNDEMETFKEQNKDTLDFFLTRSLENIIGNLSELSNRKFRKLFETSPISRTGRIGMLKNINFYKKD